MIGWFLNFSPLDYLAIGSLMLRVSVIDFVDPWDNVCHKTSFLPSETSPKLLVTHFRNLTLRRGFECALFSSGALTP